MECKTCGERLDPIQALLEMCRKQDRWKWRKDEIAKLETALAEKKKAKCEHCGKFTTLKVRGG